MNKKIILGVLGVIFVVSGFFLYRDADMGVNKESVSTSDWKTYTNSKYNYEIKYPSNLVTSSDFTHEGDKSDSVIIYDQANRETSYLVQVEVKTQPVAGMSKIHSDPLEFAKEYSSGQDVKLSRAKLSDLDAAKFNAPDQFTAPEGYIIIKDNNVYFVVWPTAYKSIAEPIIQTFKLR